MLRLLFALCFLQFLLACGSTSTPVSRNVSNNSVTREISPSQPVEDIENLFENARAETGEVQETTLTKIVKQLSTRDCQRAIFAASELLQVVTSKGNSDELLSAKLSCLVSLKQFEQAESFWSTLTEEIRNTETALQAYYQISIHRENWLEAAESFYRSSDNSRTNAEHIWKLLNNLSQAELIRANNGFSVLTPWLSLLELQRSLPLSETSLFDRLQNWKSRYPQHVFSERWPDDFQQHILIPPISQNRIAILLPLSGRFKDQGEAIKSGILGAKFGSNASESTLVFFDSNQLETLSVDELANVDVIIGPLLKENIETFRRIAPEGIPALILNRLDNTDEMNSLEHYFFSLAPEDEAQQLANQLLQNQFKNPIIIAAKSSAYQRMKLQFSSVWQGKTGFTPVSMDFENNEALREGIDGLLAIDDSKARIRQLENMATNEVHAIERSRRDIDAIIVFANASQTELINPIIESSISPFADLVPVFASSRSYSSQLNKNSLRDLRNLTFIEMPWMLPSANLRYFQNLTQKLWPNRNDTENRLFAMGYDAFNLIPALRFLKTINQTSFQGLTGKIILNTHGETIRSLTWAQVEEEEISTIAMD